ncbi:iron-containing alcohol dehydrogenase family protein [Chamaesiphon minutus]|uniref:Glycerol dehydrogenase-like oxidoreductase n=1 Tax=Chamaesiphon minutus (strain ATCC 27169 / PCC 6605) TaxID=1173020 RepID=K9UAB5_CHAP6|nr:iron-containing alcohol dehydrogenase family protein [Chamaesiphon minutus]AFY91568.1 glycerol dehydrogenase-like oxidoreductase [Chamaesiphon minutus PCC 6605]
MPDPVTVISLLVAPARVMRGRHALADAIEYIVRLGQRPLIVGGDRSLELIQLQVLFDRPDLTIESVNYTPDCCESSLDRLMLAVTTHQADVIIGIGGGKCLDTAKLLAHRTQLPVVTIPTSGATCAAWTALSNIYSESGAFLYDVSLAKCPDLLVLDYSIVATAPQRMLVAGIGDAIAKWYEASVSSGHSSQTLLIAAVQQARVLRDILFQKSPSALAAPDGEDWQEVVDATILLAGVIGGLGGAQCRTVAAHAVHNGLTHLPGSHHALHGEKVAYGILVQLRLQEMLQGDRLAATARQQLLDFYSTIGLPKTLSDLGLSEITISQLDRAATLACKPDSDLHRLPFAVTPEQLVAAMVSTTIVEVENRFVGSVSLDDRTNT